MSTNEDFFKAIGFVSVLFATLDYITSTVFLRLVGWAPGQEAPFDDRTTLGQKFKLIEQLSPEGVTDEKVLEFVRGCLPKAHAVARERNRYIHDQWVFDSALVANGRIRRARLVLGSKAEQQELGLQDLDSFAHEIEDLQKIFAKALNMLDPSAFADSGV